MYVYQFFGGKKPFSWQREFQICSLVSGGHICVHFWYTKMASPYKALKSCVTRFGQQLKNSAPLRLEISEVVYVVVFYNNSLSWSFPLTSLEFFFLRDSCVTVKTIYKFPVEVIVKLSQSSLALAIAY